MEQLVKNLFNNDKIDAERAVLFQNDIETEQLNTEQFLLVMYPEQDINSNPIKMNLEAFLKEKEEIWISTENIAIQMIQKIIENIIKIKQTNSHITKFLFEADWNYMFSYLETSSWFKKNFWDFIYPISYNPLILDILKKEFSSENKLTISSFESAFNFRIEKISSTDYNVLID